MLELVLHWYVKYTFYIYIYIFHEVGLEDGNMNRMLQLLLSRGTPAVSIWDLLKRWETDRRNDRFRSGFETLVIFNQLLWCKTMCAETNATAWKPFLFWLSLQLLSQPCTVQTKYVQRGWTIFLQIHQMLYFHFQKKVKLMLWGFAGSPTHKWRAV